MDEKYLRANIKGEYHEVRIGYFILSVPIEFAQTLIEGKLSQIVEPLIKFSDEYNKNVISSTKNPGQEHPSIQEKPVVSTPEHTTNEPAPEEEKSE